jgi:hypothetical protein
MAVQQSESMSARYMEMPEPREISADAAWPRLTARP